MNTRELAREAVLIPAMQGAVTGGFLAGAITTCVLSSEYISGSSVLPWQYTFSVSFFLSAALSTFRAQNRWGAHQLPTIQPARQVHAEYATDTKRITVLETAPNQAYGSGSIIDLPDGIHLHQVHRAALLIVHSEWSFSHALLAGTNRPFTRNQYELFRDVICFQRGWISWKNSNAHNQGVCVLLSGKNAFRYLSSPTKSKFTAN